MFGPYRQTLCAKYLQPNTSEEPNSHLFVDIYEDPKRFERVTKVVQTFQRLF